MAKLLPYPARQIQQDAAALQRYLADELVYTHGNGKRQSKVEYIAEVTKGAAHYESFTESGTNIRLYDKVAVLTGLVDVKTPKAEPYRVRTLEVYVENNGRWQLAQKESVRIPHTGRQVDNARNASSTMTY